MKKILFYLLFAILITPSLYARIIIIQAGFNGLDTFTPSVVTDAHVGDTIKWVWVTGRHTTTAITFPAGAYFWSAPLDSVQQTFVYKVAAEGTYTYQCSYHSALGMTGSFIASPIGINQIGTVVNSYELKQNYPNPFNPVTNINFSIPQKSFVSLKVYDLKGSLVQQMVNSNLDAGEYKYDFNATNLASGAYYYRIEVSDETGRNMRFIGTKQMVLIK